VLIKKEDLEEVVIKKKGDKGGQKRGPVEEEWVPVTKLGRLVNQGVIKTIEEIYTFSIPIKES